MHFTALPERVDGVMLMRIFVPRDTNAARSESVAKIRLVEILGARRPRNDEPEIAHVLSRAR